MCVFSNTLHMHMQSSTMHWHQDKDTYHPITDTSSTPRDIGARMTTVKVDYFDHHCREWMTNVFDSTLRTWHDVSL